MGGGVWGGDRPTRSDSNRLTGQVCSYEPNRVSNADGGGGGNPGGTDPLHGQSNLPTGHRNTARPRNTSNTDGGGEIWGGGQIHSAVTRNARLDRADRSRSEVGLEDPSTRALATEGGNPAFARPVTPALERRLRLVKIGPITRPGFTALRAPTVGGKPGRRPNPGRRCPKDCAGRRTTDQDPTNSSSETHTPPFDQGSSSTSSWVVSTIVAL